MIKKKIKILTLLIMIFFIISSTVSYCAPNNKSQSNNTSKKQNNTTVSSNTSSDSDTNTSTNTSKDKNARNDDLFLITDTAVLDQTVYGNVYIMASKAIIKAPVYGNVYISAPEIEFQNSANGDPVFVRESVYLLGSNINLNLFCQDLYVASSSTLNISYDSCILRDLRATVPTLNLYGIVKRNVYTNSSSISLQTNNKQTGLIEGNLNYCNDKQLSIPDELVLGKISYTLQAKDNTPKWVTNLSSCISTFLVSILFLLLLTRIAPKIVIPAKDFVFKDFVKTCLYGLLMLLLIPVLCLLFIYFFPTLSLFALSIMLIYIALIFVGFFTTMIYIVGLLKQKFNFKSIFISIGILFVISTIIYVVSLLPILPILLTILLIIPGFGLLSKALLSKK